MTAGLRIDHYNWRGGREAMLRFGPEVGPVVVAAMPLLEEANRTRAFLLSILRGLAARGVGSVLPDLPGQGDSAVLTERMTLEDLRDAFAAAAAVAAGRSGRHPFSLAIRSGSLLDVGAALAGRWRFAPMTGEELAVELERARHSNGDGGVASGEAIDVAGNLLSPALFAGLVAARTDPAIPMRVVRLATDPRPADLVVDGAPLWRRSEPGNDAALADRLAQDIAEWIARCGG